MRTFSLFLLVFALWLLLSGHFEPLLLALGLGSAALVTWVAVRMDVVDHEGHPIHLTLAALRYWPWLAWQVVKSNIDVARRILDPRLPIDPVVARIPAPQRDALGRVIYANSITLTPGTVTLEVTEDAIEVHALTQAGLDDLLGGEMARRVTEMCEGKR